MTEEQNPESRCRCRNSLSAWRPVCEWSRQLHLPAAQADVNWTYSNESSELPPLCNPCGDSSGRTNSDWKVATKMIVAGLWPLQTLRLYQSLHSFMDSVDGGRT